MDDASSLPGAQAQALTISIIIPALNEELRIEQTLRALQFSEGAKEIIVADGQSADRTAALAREMGATVISCAPGRGHQLHAATLEATGDVLWFVHADSYPDSGALTAIAEALRDPAVAGGNFSLVFEGSHYSARHMTAIYPYLRWLGLSYGDAGIFIRRSVYNQIGGCRPFPLFEDLDLVRRMKRHGRFVHLNARITTSARRFEGPQYARVWCTWIALQVLYWAGVSPHRLSRWYRHVR